jgi:hypothetical protein
VDVRSGLPGAERHAGRGRALGDGHAGAPRACGTPAAPGGCIASMAAHAWCFRACKALLRGFQRVPLQPQAGPCCAHGAACPVRISCFACIQQQGAAHARPRQAARRGRPPRAGAVHGRGRAALRRRRGRAAALVGAACRRAGRWRGGGARLARRGRVPAGVQRRRARGAPARLGQLPAPAPGGCRRARHAERSARGRRTLSARRGAA